ncbi:MAG: radical SAM family heme chaperone HemW [Rikenellaceae bacterium]
MQNPIKKCKFVDMTSLYLHIPFCRRVCGYCDFFRSVNTSRLDAVVSAMMVEIGDEADFLSDRALRTIYFGGGTPSLLSVEQVRDFLLRIADVFDVSGVEEITLEANPDDLSEEYLRGLRALGVNRLSIGVQSFDDAELKFMNRRHTAQRAREAVLRARKAGFDNIAIDLIFGVDGFGDDVLGRSIDAAIELGVEHIAAYHLTIEPKTIFGHRLSKGEMSLVAEDVSQREYLLLHDRLSAAGYDHYEISNYAKAGRRSIHNSSYWQGVEYLGVGAGAHSFNGTTRRWAVDSIEKYINGGECRYESEQLSVMDRRNEVIMTSLRCAEGVDFDDYELLFDDMQRVNLLKRAENWIKDGKLIQENSRLYIPPRFFMVSDMIIESLFDDKL